MKPEEIIKEAREAKRLTQTDVANELGIGLRMYQKIEAGSFPKFKREQIIHLDRILGINSYELIYEQKSRNIRNTPFDDVDSAIIKTKSGNIFEETEDGKYLMTVDLIPVEAFASYIMGNVDEINDWEKITFRVEKIGRGKYFAMKIRGNSMFNIDSPGYYDIKDGDVVLLRELGKHHWKDGFNPRKAPYGWVIAPQASYGEPVLKDIVEFDREKGKILCRSRNKSIEYQDFWWDLDKTHSILKVITVNHNSKNW